LTAGERLDVTARPVETERELEAALAIRRRVFCGEQGVPPEGEFDGLDGDAVHVVALDDSVVVATCRLRPSGAGFKLERMAVERGLRGSGVGSQLLAAAEGEAAERGAGEMLLHSQTRASDFYARHGYKAEGDTFLEEGIEHVAMRKRLGEGGTGE
jgi:predicted GNAT family N-acyltransferase